MFISYCFYSFSFFALALSLFYLSRVGHAVKNTLSRYSYVHVSCVSFVEFHTTLVLVRLVCLLAVVVLSALAVALVAVRLVGLVYL